MTPEQVIQFFGSEQVAAQALNIKRQTVNYWKQRNKIPKGAQAIIQIHTRGKLKADNGEKHT